MRDRAQNFIICSGVFLAVSASVMLLITLARDYAWFFLNIPSRNQTKITKDCYDWFEHYLPNTKGRHIDYSEGLFDFSNAGMTLEEATLNKYNYIFTSLGLKSGMRLLDAGCGDGVWMDYCRSRGVDVIGLTLSPEQAKAVSAKNLHVEVGDYRKEKPLFIGQFDRITALGSTEHVCSSMGCYYGNNVARERGIQTLTEVWSLFQRYLKPDGKVFVTVLTINDQAKWSMWDRFQAYVLEGQYGGYYLRMNDIQSYVAPAAGFTMTNISDQTASYHWSSMVEPKHFGYFKINWSENTWDKVSYFFTSFFKSPLHFPFHWVYQALDTWMWQFGGPQKTPLTNEQVAKAPVQLKYFMLTSTQPDLKALLGINGNKLFHLKLSENQGAQDTASYTPRP